MTQLKIDKTRKTIEAEVLLAGEEESVKIEARRYSYTREGEGGVFTVGEVIVSREWMNLLANEFLVGKSLSIPASTAKWLGLLL